MRQVRSTALERVLKSDGLLAIIQVTAVVRDRLASRYTLEERVPITIKGMEDGDSRPPAVARVRPMALRQVLGRSTALEDSPSLL